MSPEPLSAVSLPAESPRAAWRASWLFGLGVFVRTCFWLATPDRSLPNSIAYEGDAPKWLQFLTQPEGEIQLALPLHPPGMNWLLPWLTDGVSYGFARTVLVVLGALIAPLLYLVLRRCVAERVALLAGGICAVSSSLVVLGSGLHSDIPYLVLFLIGLLPLAVMRERQSLWASIGFGVTQALACLLRVDHLAFVGLTLLWLAMRAGSPGRVGAVVAMAAMGLVFLPWQMHAAKLVHDANAYGFPGRPAAPLPLANALPWDDDALLVVRQTPAFARTVTFAFVNNTIAIRGGKRVTLADLSVLDEAYGYRPEPLSTPFLAMYGPLNFCLANYETSDGTFSRAAFDHRPPLVGGVARYSPMIQVCLEPNGPVRWDYPPHLEIINHGYRIGLARMWANPGRTAWLIGQKLLIAWRGCATGIGSYALPLGMSGVREPVDMVVAEHGLATTWRILLLGLSMVGLWCLRASPVAAAVPLLGFVVAKLLAVVLFFGYARLGALCVPSLALLWAMALDRLLLQRLAQTLRTRLWWAVVLAIVLVEGARCVAGESPKMLRDGPAMGPVIGRNERVFVNY